MKYAKLFFTAALIAGAALTTGCKEDREPVDEPSDVQGLFVNEVCSGGTDWIEFHNATDTDINLSGYHVQDNKGTDEEYTFPEGSSIGAKSFLVIEEGTFEFGISGDGDSITLLDEKYAKIDEVTIPAMEDGSSYARIPDGSDNWQVVTEPTPGESNGQGGGSEDPETPSGHAAIRLNELNGNDKFIELYNISDEDVDITGVYFTKDDEDTFTAPEGTVIPAKGFLTVWSEKADGDHELIFDFGLSADKSVKIELFAPDGKALDVFKNLSTALGETWGEDDGKYDSKDLGSFARNTDGTGDWYIMVPTEGKTNAGSEVLSEKIEW